MITPSNTYNRKYTFYTKHEAEIFERAFNVVPIREFNEKLGQTVFIFQW